MKGLELSIQVHLRPESLGGSQDGLMIKEPEFKTWPGGEVGELEGGGGIG